MSCYFPFAAAYLPAWYFTDYFWLAGLVVYAVGLILFCFAVFQLGTSIRVGLPNEKTSLKTHGLYRFTRNPIYVSSYIICAGSCMMAIHPLNGLAFAIGAMIHHAIVKKEEEFLEKRFGDEWLAYKQQVPRYLGYS